jgi:hypothetical protein
MFLPEILGIEHRVPLKDVLSVTPLPDDRTLDFTVLRKFVKRRGVEVEILSPAGERETVRLWLKRRTASWPRSASRPPGDPGGPRPILSAACRGRISCHEGGRGGASPRRRRMEAR